MWIRLLLDKLHVSIHMSKDIFILNVLTYIRVVHSLYNGLQLKLGQENYWDTSTFKNNS